jgi:hypothetical protein
MDSLIENCIISALSELLNVPVDANFKSRVGKCCTFLALQLTHLNERK